MSRFFVVEYSSTNERGGRYSGKTPRGAALKAARQLFAKAPGVTKIHLDIRETGTDSIFSYQAELQILTEPKVVMIAGKSVEILRKVHLQAKGRV